MKFVTTTEFEEYKPQLRTAQLYADSTRMIGGVRGDDPIYFPQAQERQALITGLSEVLIINLIDTKPIKINSDQSLAVLVGFRAKAPFRNILAIIDLMELQQAYSQAHFLLALPGSYRQEEKERGVIKILGMTDATDFDKADFAGLAEDMHTIPMLDRAEVLRMSDPVDGFCFGKMRKSSEFREIHKKSLDL